MPLSFGQGTAVESRSGVLSSGALGSVLVSRSWCDVFRYVAVCFSTLCRGQLGLGGRVMICCVALRSVAVFCVELWRSSWVAARHVWVGYVWVSPGALRRGAVGLGKSVMSGSVMLSQVGSVMVVCVVMSWVQAR